MTTLRPLRGGCSCGRNRYVLAVPQDRTSDALVHFTTDSNHQTQLASPLAAYIRVPLSWYHSTTYAFFPDETHTMIRRVYTHHSEQQAKRQFCGFCGTQLSYWSEEPQDEADFINITLGSLLREDIRDLEDMGLIPDEGDSDEDAATSTAQGQDVAASSTAATRGSALRQSFGVPWFDSMVEGTRLGNMRRSKGIQQSHDGRVKVEWEVFEFTNGGDGDGDIDMGASTPNKRKLDDLDDGGAPRGA